MVKINKVYGVPPLMMVHLRHLGLKLTEYDQIDWQNRR